MSAALKSQVFQSPKEPIVDMQTRMECQNMLAALLERTPAIRFASMATVDGRSYAHSNAIAQEANAQRSAAIMSSLMALTESFSREALGSQAHYSSIATDYGSIVMVRVPSKAKLHTLCVCADATENLAMTIRCALDTAALLAAKIDNGH